MKRPFSRHSTQTSALSGSTRRGSKLAGFREKSVVLNAALDEYLRLKQEGTPVDANEFCERFPDYRKSLRRMIDVEECLPPLDELDSEWPEVGGLFLGYEIIELLGAGSIARVYLAAELKLGGRPVAIKISRQGGYEAETLGKLHHPSIVEVYSVSHDESSDLTAVCMPYRGSATLSDVLDAAYRSDSPPASAQVILDVARGMAIDEALPDGELTREHPDLVLQRGNFVDAVVHLGVQLASALQSAHKHGVLHRDLKPSNVLLTPHGRPMVLDFNLSFDSALNMVHLGGTLPYAAPEQLREAVVDTEPAASSVDARADVFSLGVILYELLTGKLPFGSPHSNMSPRQAIDWQLQSLERPATPPATLNSQVSCALAGTIERCLEVDPARRFASMSELEAALRGHFRLTERIQRWARRHPRLVLSAVGGLSLAIVLVSAFVARLPPYAVRQKDAGYRSLQAGNSKQAIQYFDKALSANPEYGEVLFLRGLTYQFTGEHERAVADFQAASRFYDNKEVLYDHLGYSCFHAKRPRDAYLAYSRASRNNPRYDLIIKRAFSLYRADGRSPTLGDLTLAINSAPDRYEAHLVTAHVAFEQRGILKNRVDAIEHIRKACDLRPGLAVLEYTAARILAHASRQRPELEEEAKTHLKQAVALGSPRDSLEVDTAFEHWQSQPWFTDLLKRGITQNEGPRSSIDDIAIAPPSALSDLQAGQSPKHHQKHE